MVVFKLLYLVLAIFSSPCVTTALSAWLLRGPGWWGWLFSLLSVERCTTAPSPIIFENPVATSVQKLIYYTPVMTHTDFLNCTSSQSNHTCMWIYRVKGAGGRPPPPIQLVQINRAPSSNFPACCQPTKVPECILLWTSQSLHAFRLTTPTNRPESTLPWHLTKGLRGLWCTEATNQWLSMNTTLYINKLSRKMKCTITCTFNNQTAWATSILAVHKPVHESSHWPYSSINWQVYKVPWWEWLTLSPTRWQLHTRAVAHFQAHEGSPPCDIFLLLQSGESAAGFWLILLLLTEFWYLYTSAQNLAVPAETSSASGLLVNGSLTVTRATFHLL